MGTERHSLPYMGIFVFNNLDVHILVAEKEKTFFTQNLFVFL